MTFNYTACAEKKSGFQHGSGLHKKGLLCQSDFKDHWELAESLLVPKRLGATFDLKLDNSVASIWPLFVKELRSVAEWDPAHLSYVDKLVDDRLGLENLF